MSSTSRPDPARALRGGFLALSLASAAVTAIELAMLRHWNGVEQVIPWIVLAVVAVTALALAIHPSRATVATARLVGLGTFVASAFGVWSHVHSNYETAPLNARFTDRWPSMSEPSRWWAALNGSVGASPALAPAALAFAGLCLTLATVGLAHRQRSVPGRRSPSLSGSPE
jgi:hypothetical protein